MILRAVVVQVLELLEQDPELAARWRGVLTSPPAAKPSVELLDRAGLARALKCSTAHVDRLRRLPGFPKTMLGDAPRFELEPVLRWLRARAASGDAPALRIVGGGK